MGNIVGKHRTDDCVGKMIIRSIPCKVCIQMGNRVVDMILHVDLGVVAVIKSFTVFLRPISCHFRCGEHRRQGEKVESIG